MKYILIFLLINLVSCGREKDVPEVDFGALFQDPIVDSKKVGKDVKELIDKYGKPTEEYLDENGERSISYIAPFSGHSPCGLWSETSTSLPTKCQAYSRSEPTGRDPAGVLPTVSSAAPIPNDYISLGKSNIVRRKVISSWKGLASGRVKFFNTKFIDF